MLLVYYINTRLRDRNLARYQRELRERIIEHPGVPRHFTCANKWSATEMRFL